VSDLRRSERHSDREKMGDENGIKIKRTQINYYVESSTSTDLWKVATPSHDQHRRAHHSAAAGGVTRRADPGDFSNGTDGVVLEGQWAK